MSFKSKRLRVQIPCVDESKVEVPTRTIGTCRNFQSLPPTFCYFPSEVQCPYNSHPLTCVAHRTDCFNITQCDFVTRNCFAGTRPGCQPETRVVCPGGSEFRGDPRELIEVEPDPENPGAVLIRPEDLPALREHLQAELEDAAQLQEDVRGQLEELDSIESKLGDEQG